MAQLWKSMKSEDFHNCLEKFLEKRQDFSTFVTGRAACRFMDFCIEHYMAISNADVITSGSLKQRRSR